MTTPVAVLNLLVLRCEDIDRAAVFYASLGVTFTRHRHGKGPEHYAAELPGAVFELYPAGEYSTRGVRLGFGVRDVEWAFNTLVAQGAGVISAPKDSPWGRRAVVTDHDSHTVELTQV